MKKNKIRNISLSGLFIALGILLPFLTGGIPEIGSRLLPMHIPVIICGFVCGWPYGLVVGIITPLLRSLLFTLPPIFPGAVAMAFELGAYGAIAGIFYKILPKKSIFVYITLVFSMLGGRVVWGTAMTIILGLTGKAFTWQLFVAGAFINAIPGIVLQLILIPMLIIALKDSGLIKRK